MFITIIGSGMVGNALATAWVDRGHDVVVAVRDPDKPKLDPLRNTPGVSIVECNEDAVADADVVVLAVPTIEAAPIAVALGGLAGKIVIDPTNPLASFEVLDYGTNTSSGEQIAAAIPEANVVKAFNTIGAHLFADPTFGGERASMFIAGDNEDAKAVVSQLSDQLGFETVDCGPLMESRSLEAMALLWIRLTFVHSQGDLALRLIRR